MQSLTVKYVNLNWTEICFLKYDTLLNKDMNLRMHHKSEKRHVC